MSFQNAFAEFLYFIRSFGDVFFIFHRTETQAAAGFDFQMTVKMLDTADDPDAFLHARAGPQGDGVALFTGG